jgi:hypothetical protein
MSGALLECRWHSKTVVLGEGPLRLSLGPTQVARRVRTLISPVRGRRLTGPCHNPDDRSVSFHPACHLRGRCYISKSDTSDLF